MDIQIVTSINDIVNSIVNNYKATLLPSHGLPNIPEDLALPNDLRDFYNFCGGIVISPPESTELSILQINDFERANPKILGLDGTEDKSFNWFTLAEYGGEYVTIDLNKNTLGRCYDSFWDRHAIRGSCRIIARSFTEFLSLILKNSETNTPIYWEGSSYFSLGDAYDTDSDSPTTSPR